MRISGDRNKPTEVPSYPSEGKRSRSLRRLLGSLNAGLGRILRPVTAMTKRDSVLWWLSNDYEPYIRQSAKDDFQRRLMRAIVYEEQVYEFPPFLKGLLEALGIGDSVGPSQIRVSLWAGRYGTSRRDLLAPQTHFRTMRMHLDKLERDAAGRGMSRTMENVASLWNDGDATSATSYGLRVREADLKILALRRPSGGALESGIKRAVLALLPALDRGSDRR